VRLRVVEDASALAVAAADVVTDVAARTPDAVILAATGDTPMATYAELARRADRGALDARRVRVAQLDEYLGLADDDPRLLAGWTRRAIVDPLGIGADRFIRLRAHVEDPEAGCRAYDAAVAAVGGIDLAVLGLGPNGHLGFNEPPTDADAPTRAVDLSVASRESNRRYWWPLPVPERAVTAGMATILGARRVIVLVAGAHKGAILQAVLDAAPDPALPASWLHRHPDAAVLADRAAAGR
jgi:glucosamine-6-phosphate deaminase